MRLLGLDLETTGFQTDTARITELGVALWDTDTKRPLTVFGAFIYEDSYDEVFTPDVVEMMNRVCGITPELLEEFGTPPKVNLEWLEKFVTKHEVEYLVAHNGENYDKPLLMAELTRHGVDAPRLRSLPWIDTRVDIPFASEPDSRKLKHLAGDHGFLNPFAHRAVFDVLTMLTVLSHYDIEKVIAYSKIPFAVLMADVSFQDKDKAKAERYSWEKIGEQVFPKKWVKKVKVDQVEREREICAKRGFRVIQLE